jgi:thiol-disulfide isomerase/thioredoxin
MQALVTVLIALTLSAPAPRLLAHESTTVSTIFGAGLPSLQGPNLTAASVAGRVVLVDVWATWCAPCLAELPTLRRLHAEHGDALVIVSVSLDTMPRRDLLQWVNRRGLAWPQVFDGRGPNGPLAERLDAALLPRSFLFDQQGRLVARDLRGAALARMVGALVSVTDRR